MDEMFLREEEAAQIVSAAELILKLIGKAQGRADNYAARRNEFRVIEFSDAKKKPMQARRVRRQEERAKIRHF